MIEDLWYKNTVIYSLDLETFMDSDANGVGDFEGLTQRLDYLHSLGVGAIWLAPFQRTPNRDNGYDISDYYTVDPRHGSGGDFVELMQQAEARGIKVLIDLVVNHTSSDHPWFESARNGESSPFYDWYVWSKKRPKGWNRGMVFPGSQRSTWTYEKKARAYYHHRFFDHQPDLDMTNPRVRAEVRRIMGFWLQLGVAGFRVDAVPFVIEATKPGRKAELQFEYLQEMRRFLQWRTGDAILLGEANVLPDEMRPYFGNDDGIHMMFNFFVNQHLFHSLATKDVRPLAKAIEATKKIPHTAQWAHFLRNHDELDLGRLTDEERALVFERFAPEKHMQLYDRGIRRRLAPMLGDRRHVELANSVMFSLPGTPVIRYGDEIGMGDDLTLHERDAVRTPMQWADARHGGFSLADKTVHPSVAGGVWGHSRVNVEAQRRDPQSLLSWTGRMIRLRKECPEIGWGTCTVLKTGSSHILALRYDWRENTVVVVHNFDERPRDFRLRADAVGGSRLLSLLAERECRAESGAHHILLESYGSDWFRVGDLDYAQRRPRE